MEGKQALVSISTSLHARLSYFVKYAQNGIEIHSNLAKVVSFVCLTTFIHLWYIDFNTFYYLLGIAML